MCACACARARALFSPEDLLAGAVMGLNVGVACSGTDYNYTYGYTGAPRVSLHSDGQRCEPF